MDDQDAKDKRIPIENLRQEEGAKELSESESMEPYLNFAMALMQGDEPARELDAISELPLEKRYVWRVASALKWAFADFDQLAVDADKQTLSPEDFERAVSLLRHRPLQFCLFLKALLGADEMQRMMVQAIRTATQI